MSNTQLNAALRGAQTPPPQRFSTAPPPPAKTPTFAEGHELAQTQARLKQVEHELALANKTIHEVKTVLTCDDKTWKLADRVTYAVLHLDATPDISGDAKPSKYTAVTLARAINVSENTTRNALQRMHEAGVLDYRCFTAPVNRYGEPLAKGVRINKANGDRFSNNSVTTLPASPIIKPLDETATQAKAKARAKETRDELARLREKLATLECPVCHEIGHLQITCGNCGCHLVETVETSNYDVSTNEPVNTPETSKIDACIEATSKTDVSRIGTEKGIEVELPPAQELPPAEFIDALDTHSLGGARFILANGKMNCDTGAPTLVKAAAALAAMDDGKSIKLATGTGGLIAIDIDKGLDEFLKLCSNIANAPMIYRANAPGRAKFIVSCDDAQRTARENETAKIEILTNATSGAVIAGMHPSGAPYRCKWNGLYIPVLKWREIINLVDTFIPPETIKATGTGETSTLSSVPKNKTNYSVTGGGDVKRAIEWFNQQPANQAAIYTAIKNLRHDTKGKAFALRAGDKTPSVVERDSCNGGPTWRDFGSSQTFDVFEMSLHLGIIGKSKRQAIAVLMHEWRQKHTKIHI